MSSYAFDPTDWYVTTLRSIQAWVADKLQANPRFEDVVQVEMSYPDTTSWTKETPLPKTIVHFEVDDQDDPILGFGKPGVSTFDEENGEETFIEAAMHMVNFDVGIWASAESGGATKRMEVRQALKDLFTTVGGKESFNADTEGLWVVSFNGGRDVLDRVNDVPIWRTTGMELVVRVFSKHVPPAPDVVPEAFEQDPQLTIIGNDGLPEPVG